MQMEMLEVTIGGTIVNNYDNSIENVAILGEEYHLVETKAIDASARP